MLRLYDLVRTRNRKHLSALKVPWWCSKMSQIYSVKQWTLPALNRRHFANVMEEAVFLPANTGYH